MLGPTPGFAALRRQRKSFVQSCRKPEGVEAVRWRQKARDVSLLTSCIQHHGCNDAACCAPLVLLHPHGPPVNDTDTVVRRGIFARWNRQETFDP